MGKTGAASADKPFDDGIGPFESKKTYGPGNREGQAEFNVNTAGQRAAEAISREEQRNALISQRAAIEDAETEMLEAQAAGQTQKVAALEAEIEVRTEALALMRAGVLSEEEATAVATQRFRAREVVAAQDRLQEAENAKLIAQEEAKLALEEERRVAQEEFNAQVVEEEAIRQRNEEAAGKVYGRGGRIGMVARNLGADQNQAADIGMSVIAATALFGLVKDIFETREKQTEQERKIGDEMTSQANKFREMGQASMNESEARKTIQEMGAYVDQVNEKLTAAREKADGWWSNWKRREEEILGMGFGAPKTDEDRAAKDRQTEAERVQQDYLNTRRQALGHAEEMEATAQRPAADQMTELEAKIASLREAQSHLNTETYEGARASDEIEKRIAPYQEALNKLGFAEQHAGEEAAKLSTEFDQLASKNLDPQQKIDAAQKIADGLRDQANSAAGQSFATPKDAMDFASGLDPEKKEALEKIGVAWQNATNERAKYVEEGQKAQEQFEKEDDEWEQGIADRDKEQADYLKSINEQTADLAAQHAIQLALIAGDTARADQLRDQLAATKEIRRLQDEGAPQSLIDATKLLQADKDRLAAKKESEEADKEEIKDHEKLKEIDDQMRIDHDEATKNKRALAADERAEYADKLSKKLQDAGQDPDSEGYKSRMNQAMSDYDAQHSAAPDHSSLNSKIPTFGPQKMIGGPTKHAADDTMGGAPESESDFKSQFDPEASHKDALDPSQVTDLARLGRMGAPHSDALDPKYGGAPLAPGDSMRLGRDPSKDFDLLKPLQQPTTPDPDADISPAEWMDQDGGAGPAAPSTPTPAPAAPVPTPAPAAPASAPVAPAAGAGGGDQAGSQMDAAVSKFGTYVDKLNSKGDQDQSGQQLTTAATQLTTAATQLTNAATQLTNAASQMAAVNTDSNAMTS